MTTLPIDKLRLPKETVYFTILAVVGSIIWLFFAMFLYNSIFSGLWFFRVIDNFVGYGFSEGIIIIRIIILLFSVAIAVGISYWYYLRYKARLYGETIKVSYNQYPDIYKFLVNTSQAAGIETPECFILGTNQISSFAQRVFLQKYILLESGVVDAIYTKESSKELKWLVAFYIAHHAAGHLDFWKKLWIKPAYFIPFLGKAYSRACAITADRIATYIINDVDVGKNALSLMALGSQKLAGDISVQAFREQENEIPQIPAFINKLSCSLPRTTIRLIELDRFKVEMDFLAQYTNYAQNSSNKQTTGNSSNPAPAINASTFCHACGKENVSTYRFCADCGTPSL